MIPEYEQYMRCIRGYSENTIRAYIKDIRAFVVWAKAHTACPQWSNISREDIDEFLKHQYMAGLAAATTNRQLAAISSIYNYMQRNGMEVDNPCKFESRRKIGSTVPTTIPVKQLQNAYRHAKGVKKLMLGLLMTTGIRLQEMLDLTWEDIDFDNNELRIHGKGRKDRIASTATEVLQPLRDVTKHVKASGKLFYFKQRKARFIIWEALMPFCNAKQLSPHAIRHTYATELARQGESTATIGKLLGHAHIETAQKYIDMTQVKKSHQGITLN